VQHDKATGKITGLDTSDLISLEHKVEVLATFARTHRMKGIFLQGGNDFGSLWTPECQLDPLHFSCLDSDLDKPRPAVDPDYTKKYVALGHAVARGFRKGFPNGQLVLAGGDFNNSHLGRNDRCKLPKPDNRFWPCAESPLAFDLTHEADFYAGMIVENTEQNYANGFRSGEIAPVGKLARNVIFASDNQFAGIPEMGSYQFLFTSLRTAACLEGKPCDVFKDTKGRPGKTVIPGSEGFFDSWRRQVGINLDQPGWNHDGMDDTYGNWVLRAMNDPLVNPIGAGPFDDWARWGGVGLGFAPYEHHSLDLFVGSSSCKFKMIPADACPLLTKANHYIEPASYDKNTPAGNLERHAQAVDSMVSMAQLFAQLRNLKTARSPVEPVPGKPLDINYIRPPAFVWLNSQANMWLGDSLVKKFHYACPSLDGGIAPNPLNLPCPGLVLRSTYPSRATSDN
jgi:hypothetical protein